MRRLAMLFRNFAAFFPLGPTSIVAGLTILAAAILWPGVPAVTAMALVALGATIATLARFRGSEFVLPIVLAHVAIYGALYALFIGATLHTAAPRPGGGLGLLAIFDLVLSIGPLAFAVDLVWCELRTARSAK
jgi:hypothetical protein